MRVRLGPGDLRGLYAGANMLELSGLVDAYDDEADLDIRVILRVDGDVIIDRELPADSLNYGAANLPLNPVVPPSAESVVLVIEIPKGGSHLLLRQAILAEMTPDERARSLGRWQRWQRWKRQQAKAP